MSIRHDTALAVALGVVLVAANVAFVSAEMGFVHGPEQVKESDHTRYIAMAEGPDGYADRVRAHLPPFCYRLLTPWLAYQMTRSGIGIDAAFFTLSQGFSSLFLAALFLYMRALGLRREDAALGVLLTALLPGAIRWYAYQYWMTDPAALFLVTLGFLLMYKDRHGPLAAVGTLALAARETFLLLLPRLFLRVWRRQGGRAALIQSVGVFIVPILVMLMIRTYIVAVPGPSLWHEMQRIVALRGAQLLHDQLYFVSVGSFGVLLAAAVLPSARSLREWARRPDELVVVLAVYLSLLVASNTDRLLVYAVPVIVPVAMRSLRRLSDVSGLPFGAVALAAILVQAFFYVRTPFTGPEISNFQKFDLGVTLSATAFWGAGALVWIRARRKEARA